MGNVGSLFWEEISACAAVLKCYVMDVCDLVQSIILMPCIVGMPFMLVGITMDMETE